MNSLVVQPDGKILVAGGSLYDEYYAGLLLRLNADGILDASFERADPGGDPWAFGSAISAVALQADGKVLIGGNFISVKGASRNGIARLNADGTLDSGFDPGPGANGPWFPAVMSIKVQPDGRILIGGSFSSFNGTTRNRIARLNADGSLDISFNPGAGADGVVRSIALQADGNVLIGGDFTTIDGVVRPRVARLYGDSIAPLLNIARSNTFVVVSWPSPSTGFELQQNTNLTTTNWATPSETVTDNGTTKSINVSATPGNRFFRLMKP